MTHSEGMDQEFVMKSRRLSTEAPSTLTKNIHYSPEPVVQWHCHWHSILEEEKLILGFPFFILPVADLASFLSHSTVSMTAQLFAGRSFCPHEQNQKPIYVVHLSSSWCGKWRSFWTYHQLLNLLHDGASGRRQWLPREQAAGGDNEGISCRVKAVRWRRRWYWWAIVEKSLASSSLVQTFFWWLHP